MNINQKAFINQRTLTTNGVTNTDNSNGAAVVTTLNQDDHIKCCKNKSCLRTQVLGCGSKTYLKVIKSCPKLSAARAWSPQPAQKRTDSKSKSSQNRQFVGASGYKINIKMNFHKRQHEPFSPVDCAIDIFQKSSSTSCETKCRRYE